MKVSVIIPVYNGEKTIQRCLDSVINQTLSDIEIIVVNDGSTDGTLDILNGFDDERIKVITQENSGQGCARNTGMDTARGEYIGFVDADDTIEAEMYEKMYSLAKEHDAEIVQCNLLDIWQDGRQKIQLQGFKGTVEIESCAEYMGKYMIGYIHSYEVCNKIFKRDFLLKNSLKMPDTRKYFSEDILFNMEAIKYLKRICFIKEPYYNYYQYSGSHMHSSEAKRLRQMISMFDEFLEQTDGKMYNAVSLLAAKVTAYNLVKCGKEERKEEIIKKLKQYAKAGLKSKMPFRTRLTMTLVNYAPIDISMAIVKLFY